MILPILSYGNSVLKKKALPISLKTKNLKSLINNMWETMYQAQGVGLAAPQIGESVRIFIVDTYPFSDNENLSIDERNFLKGFKKVFINPEIIGESGEECFFNEGCLSIPSIREDVKRKGSIVIKFQDLNGTFITEFLSGIAARVVQHEYDHIEGILFTDKLSFLKKKTIKRKLTEISKGKIKVDYKMKFLKN
tara:strand:- start:2106 stop:2684 length:579 start_codon:yes stop_codon:yes gene_type:complete